MNFKVKIGSLFAGVGGIELGFLPYKRCEVAWAIENDKYAQITYKNNFNHKKFLIVSFISRLAILSR